MSPRHFLVRTLGLLGLLCLPAAFAEPVSLAELAREPAWLRLLHYERGGPFDSGWRSAIHDPAFFLAPDGMENPLGELQATLAQLQAAPADDPDRSALCRFPARALWLQRRLGLSGLPRPFDHCPALRAWTHQDGIESISLVFATGYLGNPASYYGHAFLKLNLGKEAGRGRLKDTSINYGAIAAQHDDPVSYIFKGVFGGYEGGFSDSEYFLLENNYAENEFRDVWEYELDLAPDARELIVAHVWEVLGKRYTYFFFRENCAYRVAELLEIIGDTRLIPGYRPWTIPQSVLARLEQGRTRGDSLLEAIHYRPSRQSRFYQRLDALAPDERPLFTALARDPARLEEADFATRPLASRLRILDALLDYSQFVRDTESGPEARSPLHKAALGQRYRLPPGLPETAPAQPPVSPHAGRAASWVQLGLVHGQADGEAMTLRLRPAYYDWLDVGREHAPQAGLSMADLTLEVRDSEIRLRRLDLIAIESANPGRSGLPGDRGTAWNLKASVEPARLGCDSCLVPRLASDIGLGRQLDDALYAAAYLGGALQHARDDYGFGYGKASLRLLYRPATDFALRLDYGHVRPLGARDRAYEVIQLEARQALGPAFDLRLHYSHDGTAEAGIGLGYYW